MLTFYNKHKTTLCNGKPLHLLSSLEKKGLPQTVDEMEGQTFPVFSDVMRVHELRQSQVINLHQAVGVQLSSLGWPTEGLHPLLRGKAGPGSPPEVCGLS